MRKPTITDIDIMARTIYGEARGESKEGKVAVGNVISNRAKTVKFKIFGDGSIESACLYPKQFSCWNQNDPNRQKCLSVKTDDKVFLECLSVAYEILMGLCNDNTDGCDHYWARSIQDPDWSKSLKNKTLIGNHYFAKSF